VLVRVVHMKLYVDASRRGRAGLRAILGFDVTTGIGMVLLIIGAVAGGWWRDALWTVALVIDYAGPAWLTRERLRGHGDPVLAAADSYSYLHLLIVAGVIIYAGGIKMVVRHPLASPMAGPGRLAFCGGVALYLVGVSAFRLRMLGELSRGRLAVAGALLALFAATESTPAWTVGAGATVLIVGLCALESLAEHRSSSAEGAAVVAGPPPQAVARVADPDHGLE